jgi:hypothetical protein
VSVRIEYDGLNIAPTSRRPSRVMRRRFVRPRRRPDRDPLWPATPEQVGRLCALAAELGATVPARLNSAQANDIARSWARRAAVRPA